MSKNCRLQSSGKGLLYLSQATKRTCLYFMCLEKPQIDQQGLTANSMFSKLRTENQHYFIYLFIYFFFFVLNHGWGISKKKVILFRETSLYLSVAYWKSKQESFDEKFHMLWDNKMTCRLKGPDFVVFIYLQTPVRLAWLKIKPFYHTFMIIEMF